MCGIIGYVGETEAVPVLLDGLRHLEYRGYDSAGLAVSTSGKPLALIRAAGKLRNLERLVETRRPVGSSGIGHTRWATHGEPTETNAHPHGDCRGQLAVVHNGIVENHIALRGELEAQGHRFATRTDTEVISHLVEQYYDGDLAAAARRCSSRLSGGFAVAMITRSEPGTIVAARSGPPMVVGIGKREYLIASDPSAILQYTRDLVFLEDGDFVVIRPGGVEFTDAAGRSIRRVKSTIAWTAGMVEKNGFRHYMQKEIFEQPSAIRQTLVKRAKTGADSVTLEGLSISDARCRRFNQIHLVACGTSWHAALVGRVMMESLAGIPTTVDYASEFRYRNPLLSKRSLTVLVSQSGETADTLAAERAAKHLGTTTLAISNVIDSALARECTGRLYTNAGPEIGVASTKAFTSQLSALLLLAIHLGRVRGRLEAGRARQLLRGLAELPAKLHAVLANEQVCHAVAKRYHTATDFLFLGRGIHFPIALEGALKLKEISYIHAEGYPAGEMKHGPNALIDPTLPVVVLATRDPASDNSSVLFEKTLSNIQEVRARGGKVIAVVCEQDQGIRNQVDDLIAIPAAEELLLPMLEVVPLQLLAYHIARILGRDVDQPRNLAKSVTVE